MRTTPTALLFAAGREAVRLLMEVADDDAAGIATVIACVASDYGVSVEELENEVRDRTEDEYEPDFSAEADAAEEEAMHGSADEIHDGPARLHDDGYYARNDAGEYAWM